MLPIFRRLRLKDTELLFEELMGSYLFTFVILIPLVIVVMMIPVWLLNCAAKRRAVKA